MKELELKITVQHHEENNAAPLPPGGRAQGWRASTRAPLSRPGNGLQEPPPGGLRFSTHRPAASNVLLTARRKPLLD